MARITAFLIVFTLTGSPVANATCLAWCDSHQASMGHCHEDAARTGTAVISSHDTCTALLPGSPFLRLDPVSSQMTLTGTGHYLSSPLVTTASPRVADWRALDAAPSPPLVLRL
jgi:hypothetical protein